MPPPQQPIELARVRRSPCTRAVARLLVVLLVLGDLPRVHFPANADDASSVRHVSGSDATCGGQTPCYGSILAALADARPGDTVRVQAGRYREAISIRDRRDVVLEADPGAAPGTVILSGASPKCAKGDAVRIESSTNVTLRGFTITGAAGQAVELVGGGKQSTHVVLERNRIFGNGTRKCQGGIRIGTGNADTVLLNNVIYGNAREGVRLVGGQGGPHYLVHNVIHRNGRTGVSLTKARTVVLVNNLITQNGTDGKPKKQLGGIRRRAPRKKPLAENARLLHNLVCGNSTAELAGAMLDGADARVLTPTGSEGPGAAAIAGCQSMGVVYADLDGADDTPNTADDDFRLAAASPGVDTGIDPRTLGIPVTTVQLAADLVAADVRPRDGDGDGTAAFDLGALERPAAARTESCYEGPAGTEGVGICRGGTRTVPAGGAPGPCVGQVLPQAEACNALDDDCSGIADDGGMCLATTTACYEGPPGTEGVGICHGGTRTVPAGGPPGPCLGQALPRNETCNASDDDCDGAVDEEGVCPEAPTITSTPVTTATAGEPYLYQVEATDPDPGDTLSYVLDTAPGGMQIDGGTGTITWTPSVAQVGSRAVSVRVQDQGGLAATQAFTIDVVAEPKANEDHYEVQLGQTLVVDAPGTLANDANLNGGALSARQLTDPDAGKGTLTAFNADGSFTFVAPPTYPAAPFEPVERFSWTAPSVLEGPPVVGDVDADGKADIVIMASGFALNFPVTAVSGADGSELWQLDSIPAPYADCRTGWGGGYDTQAIGDIDDDGKPEVVLVVGCSRDSNTNHSPVERLLALNGADGTVKWLSTNLGNLPPNSSLGAVARTTPTIARLSPGESPSILLGADSERANCSDVVAGAPAVRCRVVIAVDGVDGSVRRKLYSTGAPLNDWTYDMAGTQFPAPVAFDLDGDGSLEIVWAGVVFDAEGNVRWEKPHRTRDVALANLDATPDVEVLFLETTTNNLARLHAHKPNGTLLWTLTLPLVDPNEFFSHLTVGDVDNDGSPDILFNSDTTLYAIDRQGSVKWTANTGSVPAIGSRVQFATRHAIFDLDDDGVPEVLAHANDALLILDGTNGATKRVLSFPTAYYVAAEQPVVADLDGDGHAEIVYPRTSVTGFQGAVHVLRSAHDDWRPARPIQNQEAFYDAGVEDDGTIPRAPANPFALARTNVFGTQAPAPYAPAGRPRSQTAFYYAARDGDAGGGIDSNPAKVTIDVLPENRPPRFTSTPPTRWVPASGISYDADVVDPDPGDPVTFSIRARTGISADRCTINASSGVFTCPGLFNPQPPDLAHTFLLIATDSHGAVASQTVSLVPSTGVDFVPDVRGIPQPAAGAALVGAGFVAGSVTSVASGVTAGLVVSQSPIPGTPAALGSAVTLVVSLGPPANPLDVDDDGDGVSENQGDCDDGAAGTNPTAVDSLGDDVDQNCDEVDGVLPIASIVVEPATALRLTGEHERFEARALLADGTSKDVSRIVVWDSAAPGVATVASGGVTGGRAVTVAEGTTAITATRNGIGGSATLEVRARMPADAVPPSAAIATPADGATITGAVDVTGTAADEHFLAYVLEYAPAGEDTFTPLVTRTTPVVNGVLGRLDPTLLVNDQYTIRLRVVDAGGNEASTEISVQVAREKKVGLFTLAYEDVTVPVSGVPLVVTRIYDSRDKRTGEFGVGWRLGVQTLRVRPSRQLGSGWFIQRQRFSYLLTRIGDHSISVTLPDGRVEKFDLAIAPSGSAIVPLQSVTASYVPRPGTLGRLFPLDNASLIIIDPQPGDVQLLDDLTLNPFDPQRFRYVTADGQTIDLDRSRGVERVTDRNGNTLTFGANGITHSAGPGVAFVRDAQGRITRITDPGGGVRSYAYDSNGDLVASTDQVGNTTRYTYDRTHGLLDVLDPTGTRAARNEYDADGRLVATIDAAGKRIEITHDLGTQQEVVRDRLGHVTVHAYDAAGNVVATTDALGQRTEFTYDARGSELTRRDPLGRVETRTYDARDNLLTRTDADGNTTAYTYDAQGNVLTATEPGGKTTSTAYDAGGNLTQTTDPDAGITRYTYDARGNRLMVTDPLGRVTRFTYDGAGRKTSETDPLGVVTTFTLDANGKVVGATRAGTSLGSTSYDAASRATGTVDAVGAQRSLTYSPLGDGKQPATTTDAAGRTTTFSRDARGVLTGALFPDGSSVADVVDAENHITSRTDRDGHTTTYAYDALGRLLTVTNPDGSTRTRTYDALGRLLTLTTERGFTTRWSYAPNQQTVTDALGQVTVHTFDGRGQRIQTVDALGHTTRFTYDGRGHLVTTTFADGSTKTTTYDAAGQKVGEIDQAGRTTTFAYNAVGRLTGVTNPAGETTTYGYDTRGNLTSQTDAANHKTTLAYDAVGRLTRRTRPLGQQETFTYTPGGAVASHVDFNGRTTTFAYDAADRVTKKTLPDATMIAYAYLPSGKRTQAGGDVAMYDLRGRLVKETKASGDVVSYTYDAAGNRTAVTSPASTTSYTYDALDRLATVTDTGGTTTYTYDAVGNLASTAYPNGVTTAYAYDTLNRLLQVTHSRAGGLMASYTYTLGAAGNRVQVVEAGPATLGRTVAYTYDAASRLTTETIDAPGTAGDRSIAYTYDVVGNRTRMVNGGVVTDYLYDANDRLLTETTGAQTLTSTYDANGNLRTRSNGMLTDTYTYDDENRLVSANVELGTTPGLVSYTYDADGMRTSRTAGGQTTTYLVDKSVALPQVLAETTGTAVTTYTYGLERVSQTGPGTGVRFHLADGQRSVRQLTNAAGAVTDTYTYDAFGVLLATSGTTPNPYRYTGEALDPNVGFYYLRARYYAPAFGRFVTTDPEVGSVFDPVSLHRYLYANADPVDNRDPSGRFTLPEISVTAAIGGVLSAGFGAGLRALKHEAVWDLKLLGADFVKGAILGAATVAELGVLVTFIVSVLVNTYADVVKLHLGKQDVTNQQFVAILGTQIALAGIGTGVGEIVPSAVASGALNDVYFNYFVDPGRYASESPDEFGQKIFWYAGETTFSLVDRIARRTGAFVQALADALAESPAR